MKKTLFFAAAAATFACAAHAQSSVTLYGVVDAGITYTSNVGSIQHLSNGNNIYTGKSQWAMTSGNASQSMFGLKGREDLGGGLAAIFKLESGFNLNNGSEANNGNLFNRQAWVGLTSDYGTLTFGRQYDSMQDAVAPLSATGSWGGTYFAHPYNFDNLSTNNGAAVNNSVKFQSADYAGFRLRSTYGFSNTTNFGRNRERSIGATYDNGPIHVAAAYAQQNDPNNGPGASDQVPGFSVLALPAQFRDRQFGAGVSYDFGPATVGFVWTQSRLDNFPAGSGGTSLSNNNYEINGKYALTPALTVGAMYTYSTLKGYGDLQGDSDNSSPKAHTGGLMADYMLSKRTDVYAQAVYQHISSDVGANVYTGTSQLPANSNSQTVVSVGMRHRF